jgi:hypothetical protein
MAIIACAGVSGCSNDAPVDWDAVFNQAEAIEYRRLDGRPPQVTARVRLTGPEAIASLRGALEQTSQAHHDPGASLALAVVETVAVDRGSNGETEFYVVDSGEWLLMRGRGLSSVQLEGDALRRMHERFRSELDDES